MNKNKIKEMLLELLNEIDYDIAKNYDEETAEEPELVEESMDRLVSIVNNFLEPKKKKK